jgi:hypothetical protein
MDVRPAETLRIESPGRVRGATGTPDRAERLRRMLDLADNMTRAERLAAAG